MLTKAEQDELRKQDEFIQPQRRSESLLCCLPDTAAINDKRSKQNSFPDYSPNSQAISAAWRRRSWSFWRRRKLGADRADAEWTMYGGQAIPA